MRLVVLVSGRGSNLRALVDAIEAGTCAARVVGVVTDRRRCPALEYAQERDIATRTVRPRDHADRDAWDAALADAVGGFEPELVVLAGFMRLVGKSMLARFERRIVNVHPSLLPAFPGLDAPQQALDAGVTETGCTVHYVDAGVDTGDVLARCAVPIEPGDDAASLHARIQRAEHWLFPRVVDALARGQDPSAVGDSHRDATSA